MTYQLRSLAHGCHTYHFISRLLAIAAVAGCVGSLLIDGSRQITGQLNLATGAVELDSLSNPGVEDLLDDLGELILTKGGPNMDYID